MSFHIGPHKMATTFVQDSIRLALKRVLVNGVAGHVLPDGAQSVFYIRAGQPAVAEIRDRVNKAYDRGDASVMADLATEFHARALAPIIGDYERIVIIDENFMGGQLAQYVRWDRLYPTAPINALFHKRLRDLVEADGLSYRLVASMRVNTAFVESSFVNIMRDNAAYMAFANYRRRFDEQALTWSDYFAAYEGASSEPLRVVPFEAILGDEQGFLDAFSELFWPGLPIRPKQRPAREGFSAPAIAVLRQVEGTGIDGDTRRRLVNALVRALPKGRFAAPCLFTEAEKTALRAHYAADNRAVFDRYVALAMQPLFDRHYRA